MSAAPIKLAAALLLTLAPAAALGQSKPVPKAKAAAKAAPALPSAEQLRAASDTLSLIVSALNSKEVPQATKNGLFLCLYGNPLGKISRGQTLALAAGKTAEPASPTQRLLVLAELCDAPSPGAAAPAGVTDAPAAEPAPTPPRQPEGR